MEPTNINSKREAYYVTSTYIAEFWCFVSSIAILMVSIMGDDLLLITTSVCSALSHALPYKFFHRLDMIMVWITVLRFSVCLLAHFQSEFFRRCAVAVIINAIDTYFTRKYLKQIGPWLHVLWHLYIAYLFYYFSFEYAPIVRKALMEEDYRS